MTAFGRWLRRVGDDPQALLLVAFVGGGLLALHFFARPLAPFVAAVVLAFILDRPTEWLRGRGWSDLAAASAVFLLFLVAVTAAALLILPPVLAQVQQFVGVAPEMFQRLKGIFQTLPSAFPGLVGAGFLQDVLDSLSRTVTAGGQQILNAVLRSLRGVVTGAVYLILTLLMLFFLLKDKHRVLAWLARFLPAERPLLDAVFRRVVDGAGDYARGKVYEILIVGLAAWILYAAFGLSFAALLAVLTGLSVIVPYVGATVVTLPVALVAFFQWGLGADFWGVVAGYLILQAIDGNLLAPLLMSEMVRIHPVAVVLAILAFGHLWGMWGVFFAIPLAVLIHATIEAWRDHLLEREAQA
ncbi:MAG: AI-2E family transporter [Rhodothalassiaceae bacterium]|nr:MAG: AI-2E family transporter [Rhodothalassiaceae bacterium]